MRRMVMMPARAPGQLALIAALFVAALVLASCGVGAADQQGLVEHGSDGGAQDMDHGNSGGMEGMDMGGSGERTPVSELPEARMQGPTRMGDLVMPPGMVMTADQSMEAMEDMAAVNPEEVDYAAPADARGDRTLEPTIENGVKVFDLDVSVIEWSILPNQRVEAYAFNRQVPGPRIRVDQGDRVRINVTNDLPEPTSVHWHGLVLPNGMDGAGDVTQSPIEPGGSFTYEFTAGQQGTYFYHSHTAADRQQALGMYGALIVDPADPSVDAAYDYDKEAVVQLQEWTAKAGYTFPAMPMEGALPNFFTINGKSYPETETINMELGERLRIRFVGSSTGFAHPMHIHGGPFEIVQTDGEPVPEAAQLSKDTVNVAPGERYDVIWEAREPGKWLLHCHILHHTTNDNVEVEGGGGLTMVINVAQ